MNLTNLKELESLLNSRGFFAKYFDYLGCELIGIDFYDEYDRHLSIETEYQKDYYEYLKTLPEDTEFEVDYNKVHVKKVNFESCIKYPEDNEYNNKCFLTIDEYYNTFPKYFERAYNAFMNPDLYAIEIQRLHANYTEKFLKVCKPILLKYDFINVYDSYWDAGYYSRRTDSCPTFEYKFNNLDSAYFYTDLLTQKFMINGIEVNFEDFENQLINIFMKWSDGSIKLSYEYLLLDDSKYTKESGYEVYNLISAIDYMERHHEKYVHGNINFDLIPDKYKDLIVKYNKLKNNYD